MSFILYLYNYENHIILKFLASYYITIKVYRDVKRRLGFISPNLMLIKGVD